MGHDSQGNSCPSRGYVMQPFVAEVRRLNWLLPVCLQPQGFDGPNVELPCRIRVRPSLTGPPVVDLQRQLLGQLRQLRQRPMSAHPDQCVFLTRNDMTVLICSSLPQPLLAHLANRPRPLLQCRLRSLLRCLGPNHNHSRSLPLRARPPRLSLAGRTSPTLISPRTRTTRTSPTRTSPSSR